MTPEFPRPSASPHRARGRRPAARMYARHGKAHARPDLARARDGRFEVSLESDHRPDPAQQQRRGVQRNP